MGGHGSRNFVRYSIMSACEAHMKTSLNHLLLFLCFSSDQVNPCPAMVAMHRWSVVDGHVQDQIDRLAGESARTSPQASTQSINIHSSPPLYQLRSTHILPTQ